VVVANYIAALQFLNTKEVLDGLSAGRPRMPSVEQFLLFVKPPYFQSLKTTKARPTERRSGGDGLRPTEMISFRLDYNYYKYTRKIEDFSRRFVAFFGLGR
jgi:hypothetical protein